MTRRELLLPSAAASLVTDAVVTWTLPPGGPTLTRQTITVLTLLWLARTWFSLILCNVALGLLRRQESSIATRWVPVTDALRIGLVTIVLALPIALGTLFLIAPGVYLLVIWSQATMVLIDRRARLFDATSWSESLTDGYRWQILGVWIVVWGGAAILNFAGDRIASTGGPGAFPAPVAVAVSWSWNILMSTLGVALIATTYVELVSRAPWEPRHELVP